MSETILEQNLIETARELNDAAFDLNLYLADHPEISGEEYNSVEYITNMLEDYGINCEKGILNIPTAFKGEVSRSDTSDINIAIITEYDALPGIGHACGHCASCAISILSALSLKKCFKDYDANIDIIGTPDEENIGMKIPMADSGFFDKYDLAIMIHMSTQSIVNWKFLAFETYDFTFKGKASHASAAPWDGRNAEDGMLLMFHAFDMMRQRLKDGSRIEGIILESGKASNIIPDRAKCRYTFRAKEISYLRESVLPMVFDAAKGAAMATQTEVEFERFGFPFLDMKILPSGEKVLTDIFSKYGIEKDEITDALGSSDMGNVSYRCPSFHPSISVSDHNIPLHTVEFEAAMRTENTKNAILKGAIVILAMIAKVIEDEDFRMELRREFEA
ncbi:MAG: peptidase dimerization domain-containing protein [Tissierellia bacterium]|nr:peptidase dimerization domain-containing protein [Tissierellia bacterium]